jgi:chemotaxis protein MotB
MPKETWTIAGILTIALLLGLLGFSSYDKKVRLDQAQSNLAEARVAAAKTTAELSAVSDKLAASEQRSQQLEQEKQAAEKSHQNLETEMKSALESKDVTISQLQGKLTVNILDRIMFESGEAELKTDGETVLKKVAAVLGQHTNLMIHVVGHTDNVPIRTGARSRFSSNWELSTARATAAVRFLTEKAGMDPHRLGAVGYGEFRPVADNSTPEGRAKNRRIAIILLPDQGGVLDDSFSPASLAANGGSPADVSAATNAAPRLEPSPAAVDSIALPK